MSNKYYVNIKEVVEQGAENAQVWSLYTVNIKEGACALKAVGDIHSYEINIVTHQELVDDYAPVDLDFYRTRLLRLKDDTTPLMVDTVDSTKEFAGKVQIDPDYGILIKRQSGYEYIHDSQMNTLKVAIGEHQDKFEEYPALLTLNELEALDICDHLMYEIQLDMEQRIAQHNKAPYPLYTDSFVQETEKLTEIKELLEKANLLLDEVRRVGGHDDA